MKLLILFLSVAILSCGSDGTLQIAEASEEEEAAVNMVLDFYDGECHRSKGFDIKNGEKETFFQLTMKKSESLEQYLDLLEMPASNIAYLFYTNLNKDRSKYTHVKVRIELAGGEIYEDKYSVDQLELIERNVTALGQVTTKMMNKDYPGLLAMFDDDVSASLTVEQLDEYCSRYDTALGAAKTSQLQGFSYLQDENSGKHLIHLAGILEREKENSPISLFINAENRKLNTLKFEF